MVVRAVKIINARGSELDAHPSVRVGHDYLVLEMWAAPDSRLIRILDDEGGAPGLWPLEMFEVVSPRISSNWGASIEAFDGKTYLDLAPIPWLRPGFWLEYFDRGWEGAAEEFDRALAEMAAEEGLQEDGRFPPPNQ